MAKAGVRLLACQSDGDDLRIYDPNDHDKVIEEVHLPATGRQEANLHQRLLPFGRVRRKDVIGFTCVHDGTARQRRGQKAFETNDRGVPLRAWRGETAEALAEYWQSGCTELGIGNGDSPKIRTCSAKEVPWLQHSPGYRPAPT